MRLFSANTQPHFIHSRSHKVLICCVPFLCVCVSEWVFYTVARQRSITCNPLAITRTHNYLFLYIADVQKNANIAVRQIGKVYFFLLILNQIKSIQFVLRTYKYIYFFFSFAISFVLEHYSFLQFDAPSEVQTNALTHTHTHTHACLIFNIGSLYHSLS